MSYSYKAFLSSVSIGHDSAAPCCTNSHSSKGAAMKCASKMFGSHNSGDDMNVFVTYDRYSKTIIASDDLAVLTKAGDRCPRCYNQGRNGIYIESHIGAGVIECNSCPNARDSRLDFAWKNERTMRTKSKQTKIETAIEEAFRPSNERGDRHVPINGHAHPIFSDLVNRIKCQLPVMLVGEAGTGKTFIAEQVAEYLGRPFATISCTGGMSESQLTGRLLPLKAGGTFEYLPTELVRMVKEGGIFLADEFDAADPNVALVLNQLSANRRLVLPNNPAEPCIDAHEDFVIIFSANTFGTGSDRMYVGRNQMDAATLDRVVMGTITVDYDNGLERKLVSSTPLRRAYQDVRKKAQAARIRRTVSMRAMINAQTCMDNMGWSVEECIDQLCKAWTPDERAKCGVATR